MARRKSLTRRVTVLSILALACFGGYTLYQRHQKSVDGNYEKVSKKVRAVKKALEK
jgi:predicted negative regulator of RcsB-dependent stress response